MKFQFAFKVIKKWFNDGCKVPKKTRLFGNGNDVKKIVKILVKYK